MHPPTFADIAMEAAPTLDRVALALAAAFRPVDAADVLGRLDALAAEVADDGIGTTPAEQVDALVRVLGRRHGFTGERQRYYAPESSMLDVVLERRRGLPILLAVVYVEVARRVGIRLRGVALPGHFVAAHVDASPPIVIDPFDGGAPVDVAALGAVEPQPVHDTALRMLSNLVGAYERAHDPGRALRAARLRLLLPVDDAARPALEAEARRLGATFN